MISLIGCMLVLACSQTLYIPSAETVSNPDELAELTEGRRLYINSCAGCHNLYPPQKFTSQHWAEEMVEMKEEAKITDEQAALILKYLIGFKEINRES